MNASQFQRKRAAIERRARGRASFMRKALAHLVREAHAVPVSAGRKVLGYKMPGGSVACEKQRYRDDVVANIELVRIARFAIHAHIPVRAYLCDLCGGFHLTSKS